MVFPMANTPTYTTVRWPLVYFCLAVAGLVVLALKRLRIPPFGAISGLVLATVLAVVFAVVSLLYWWEISQDDVGGGDNPQ